MKKLIITIAAFFAFILSNAQNVGIGTTTPTSKLNVNGQVTIDQKNFGGYGGLLIKGNVPGSNYPNIMFSTVNTSGSDVVGAGIQGELASNTAGSESINLGFYTTQAGFGSLSQRMIINGNGNVGIGEGNPGFPLNFSSNLGDKISLWGNGPNHYGFGIQGGLLQMHTATATDGIAFGYGSSNSFTENMRILGNGNVGIGTTVPNGYGHGGNNKILEIKNPNSSAVSQSQLVLSTGAADGSMGGITWAQHNVVSNPMAGFLGLVLEPFNTGTRMVMYTRNTSNVLSEKMTIDGNGNMGIGTNTPTAKLEIKDGGLRFNNSSTPTASNSITSSNGYLTLFGGSATGGNGVWINNTGSAIGGTKFQATGAIEIAGSEGTSGQVLTSNGPGTAATWANKPKYFGNSPYFTSDVFTEETVSSITITVTKPSTVLLSYSMIVYNEGCPACLGDMNVRLFLRHNTQLKTYQDITARKNKTAAGALANYKISLSAGTHTFTVSSQKETGNGPYYIGRSFFPTLFFDNSNFTVQLIED